MNSVERTSLIADLLRTQRYTELADALNLARLRLARSGRMDDECSVCQSILFHAEKYIRSIGASRPESATEPKKKGPVESEQAAFFDVWYSLGAFGIEPNYFGSKV